MPEQPKTIACPYCGEAHSTPDKEIHYDGDEEEVTCAECGNDFWIITELTISFSAEKCSEE